MQFDGYSPLIGSAAEGARVNQVTDKILTGTLGELLVQARLLQYGVQAAPPIKDSGNDLIAVNGNEFRAVSVRTTTTGTYGKPDAARLYHVLAVVYLVGDDRDVSLDHSEIFLIPRAEVAGASTNYENLGKYKFSRQLVEQLFGQLPD
ncbi:MAG TPA: hypothetical protein VF590_13420 [Isosphaeraceae bacterium]